MRKTFLKLAILVLILVSTSCLMSYDYRSQGTYVGISSDNIFSIGGSLYIQTYKYLPVTIYNPNNYTITVMINKEAEFVIDSSQYVTIEEESIKD